MKRSELSPACSSGCRFWAAVAVPLICAARTPLIHARMAEAADGASELCCAAVGVPLHLRLISDDVMHGFAVGKLDAASVDVMPGKITDVTLLFDRPGTYTFYCTRWCGLNHWRMRGTIEVDGAATAAAASAPPLYASLGMDLDAPRARRFHSGCQTQWPHWRRSSSPPGSQPTYRRSTIAATRPTRPGRNCAHDPDLRSLGDAELWDTTAWIWRSNTTPQALADGRTALRAELRRLPRRGRPRRRRVRRRLQTGAEPSMRSAMHERHACSCSARPTWPIPQRMLAASPALLQGKILRGGMGTGMPSWGPIFTEAQTWDLVAYLYTFQFDYP